MVALSRIAGTNIMQLSRQRAFNLLELLVCMAVLAILTVLAIPSGKDYIQKNRQLTAVNEMIEILSYSRWASITSGVPVSLCSGELLCNNSKSWEDGILVFKDANRNGQIDATESVLRANPPTEKYRWDWSNFRNKTHMTFMPNGTTDSLNGTFTLCLEQQAVNTVVLNITRRGRRASPANSANCNR